MRKKWVSDAALVEMMRLAIDNFHRARLDEFLKDEGILRDMLNARATQREEETWEEIVMK
jgi:hypothetical protein